MSKQLNIVFSCTGKAHLQHTFGKGFNVVCFPVNLCLGRLFPTLEHNDLRTFIQSSPERLICPICPENTLSDLFRFFNTLRKAQDTGTEFVVWNGSSPDECLMLYMVCRFFGDSVIISRLICPLPYTVDRLLSFHDCFKLQKSQIRDYAEKWDSLACQNFLLRAKESEDSIGVKLSFYDSTILHYCGDDFQTVLQIIAKVINGEDLFAYIIPSDFIVYRLVIMAGEGLIETKIKKQKIRSSNDLLNLGSYSLKEIYIRNTE